MLLLTYLKSLQKINKKKMTGFILRKISLKRGIFLKVVIILYLSLLTRVKSQIVGESIRTHGKHKTNNFK